MGFFLAIYWHSQSSTNLLPKRAESENKTTTHKSNKVTQICTETWFALIGFSFLSLTADTHTWPLIKLPVDPCVYMTAHYGNRCLLDDRIASVRPFRSSMWNRESRVVPKSGCTLKTMLHVWSAQLLLGFPHTREPQRRIARLSPGQSCQWCNLSIWSGLVNGLDIWPNWLKNHGLWGTWDVFVWIKFRTARKKQTENQ